MHFSDINMNVVFEDLWGTEHEKQKSLELFEEQLILLSDDIIKNERWNKRQYQSLLGNKNIVPEQYNSEKNYCGAAVMRSIDSDGLVYPCFRLSPYSIKEEKTFNIENKEVARSLKLLNNVDAVPQKCRECELLPMCAMCVGNSYEEYHSIFSRTTHHCEFVKLQNKYSVMLRDKIQEKDKSWKISIYK